MAGRVKREPLVHCGSDSKLEQTFYKTAWGVLKELKIEPPYHPAILLLGIYSRIMKSVRQRDCLAAVLIAAGRTTEST